MPAVRVVDEHLRSPVLVYSSSGGVFENEKILTAGTGLSAEVVEGRLEIRANLEQIVSALSKSYVNEIVFNETLLGTRDGINCFFALSSTPTDSSTVQIWYNGALLTQDSDYSLSDRVVHFLFEPPPILEDVILASYSRSLLLKRYKFGERIFINSETGSASLQNAPSSPQDLMLFYNGQLLTRGSNPGSNDYTLSGNTIFFPRSIVPQDVILATYSYF
jgi:hypothetical protein